jgi:hypothetical protein
MQLGVGIKTDEDRRLAKLLQTPKGFWIGLQRRISWICESGEKMLAKALNGDERP